MNTITLAPHKLKTLPQHWARKLLPPPDAARIKGLYDALADGATLPPGYLFRDPQGRHFLVAGEGRKCAHLERGEDMEFIETDNERLAVMTTVQENSNRAQIRFDYQKGWDACPVIERTAEKNKEERIIRLKHHPEGTEFPKCDLPANIEDFANLLGVSEKYVDIILKVWRNAGEWDINHEPRQFAGTGKPLTARDFITARVHDAEKPCSPGQAWAGIAGSDAAAEGRTAPEPKLFQLFLNGFNAVAKWGKGFTRFQGRQKTDAMAVIKKTVAAFPKELRAELLAELKRLDREERE
ncbi:MAG TPA: hypothetical protein VIK53_19460 [Verrucomicrobiae bacterium]